jgi:hypothetical protein
MTTGGGRARERCAQNAMDAFARARESIDGSMTHHEGDDDDDDDDERLISFSSWVCAVTVDSARSDARTPRRDVVGARREVGADGIESVSVYTTHARRIERRARRGTAWHDARAGSFDIIHPFARASIHPAIHHSHVGHRHGTSAERFRDDVTRAKVCARAVVRVRS